jgi:hypothetical protein
MAQSDKSDYNISSHTYSKELAQRYVKSKTSYKKHCEDSSDFRHYVYFLVTEIGYTPVDVHQMLDPIHPISERRVYEIVAQVKREIEKGGKK